MVRRFQSVFGQPWRMSKLFIHRDLCLFPCLYTIRIQGKLCCKDNEHGMGTALCINVQSKQALSKLDSGNGALIVNLFANRMGMVVDHMVSSRIKINKTRTMNVA